MPVWQAAVVRAFQTQAAHVSLSKLAFEEAMRYFADAETDPEEVCAGQTCWSSTQTSLFNRGPYDRLHVDQVV